MNEEKINQNLQDLKDGKISPIQIEAAKIGAITKLETAIKKLTEKLEHRLIQISRLIAGRNDD